MEKIDDTVEKIFLDTLPVANCWMIGKMDNVILES